MRQDAAAIQFASQRLLNSSHLILAAVDRPTPWSDSKYHDKIFVLQFASKRLRDEHAVVLAAVRREGWSLRYASSALQGNYEIVIAAVLDGELNYLDGSSLSALKFASERLRGHHEVVLAAVTRDGLALCFASSGLRDDREVVLAAIYQNALALEFASDALRKNAAICREAVSRSPEALKLTLNCSYSSGAALAHTLDPATILEAARGLNPGTKCLSDQTLAMYRDGICTDVRVVLDCGAVIMAHRFVLVARSSVLSAQLSNGMLETQSSVVHMQRCSHEAADAFLRYLYSGMSEDWRDEALLQQLNILADYYGIIDLMDVLRQRQRVWRRVFSVFR